MHSCIHTVSCNYPTCVTTAVHCVTVTCNNITQKLEQHKTDIGIDERVASSFNNLLKGGNTCSFMKILFFENKVVLLLKCLFLSNVKWLLGLRMRPYSHKKGIPFTVRSYIVQAHAIHFLHILDYQPNFSFERNYWSLQLL